jgi:hypothetical protein
MYIPHFGVAIWYVCKPKSKFGGILESFEMENVGIFYVFLDYFMAIS